MSQLSLLSIDAAQSYDIKADVKADSAKEIVKNNTSEIKFSDVIDEHYTENEVATSDKSIKASGKNSPKAANNIKLNQESTDPVEITKEKSKSKLQDKFPHEEHILPVPISPEVDIALKSLAKKTNIEDDAPILPITLLPETNDLVKKTSIEDDAPILPVTLLPETDDLVKKPNIEDDAPILPVSDPSISVSSTQELKLTSVDKKTDDIELRNNVLFDKADDIVKAAKETNTQSNNQLDGVPKKHKLNVLAQSIRQENLGQEKVRQENSKIQSVAPDNDVSIDLLKMLSGAEKLLTKTDQKSSEVINADVKNVQKNSQVIAETTRSGLSEQKNNSDKVGDNSILSQLISINKNSDELGIGSEITQDEQRTQQKNGNAVQTQFTQNSTNQDQHLNKNDLSQVISSEYKVDQDNVNVASLGKKVSLKSESATDKVMVNLEAVENNKLAAQEVKEQLNEQAENKTNAASQAAASHSPLKAEGDNNVSQTRVINQSTAAVVTTSNTKFQGQSEQSQENSNQNADNANEPNGDEATLAKISNENSSVLSEKVASVVNQTLEAQAQAQRSAVNSEQLAMQQEHNFESAIQKINATTVHSQKQINALNVETISIYRKDFADSVKDKVMIMINQKIQQVEIQLDPPEMGNIHVRVNLQNEQAAVQFVVQNQQAKEALEQNMGKLRDMLSDSGVDVGDANIEQRDPGQKSQAQHKDSNGSENNSDMFGQEESSDMNVAHAIKASSTGVDYYA